MKLFIKNVPFTEVRHNTARSYKDEGFGGQPLEEWPVYQFFIEYLTGNKEYAQKKFETWYSIQLDKYYDVSKKYGGMKDGSLYQLVQKECGGEFQSSNSSCRNIAIQKRVKQRFELIDEIKTKGYKTNDADRIEAVMRHGHVYLLGGHHRAAALLALGKKELPGVKVFPNMFVYSLIKILRSFKYGF